MFCRCRAISKFCLEFDLSRLLLHISLFLTPVRLASLPPQGRTSQSVILDRPCYHDGWKDLLLITTFTELLFVVTWQMFQSYLLLVAKVILSVVPRPGYCAAIDDVQVCGPRQCESVERFAVPPLAARKSKMGRGEKAMICRPGGARGDNQAGNCLYE